MHKLDFDTTPHADFGALTHLGVGGGTHRRRATFERYNCLWEVFVCVWGFGFGWFVVLVLGSCRSFVRVRVGVVLFSVGVCARVTCYFFYNEHGNDFVFYSAVAKDSLVASLRQ